MSKTQYLNVKQFLNSSMLDYSVYKLIQQLPFIIDGLSQTQRKIIWTLLNKPKKKYKTADSYSLIYEYTNYLHGNASAENVWNVLSADYKNNINILTPKGSFGYRTIQQAAAPRYTSSILSNIAQKIFSNLDKEIRQKQFLEGHEIEPVQLFPIIPIGLINGISGIAVGYSSNVLPRDPKFLIDLLIGIIEGKIKKIPKILPIKLPYFKGKIYNGDNDKQFIFEGNLYKDKATKRFGWIIIDEVPWGYDREKMVKILNALEDQGKVVEFHDSCIKNEFYFKIKVPIEIYNLSKEKLINLFKLRIKQSEVLTFIKINEELQWDKIEEKVFLKNKENFSENFDKEIKTYNNAAEYLYDWIIERLKIYKKRKFFQLSQIKYNIMIFKEKARFIQSILNKEIIIERKKKKEIETQLKENDFHLINDNYDYLLGMNLWSLSDDKIKELNNNIKKLEKEYKDLEKITEKQIWLNELKALKTDINKINKEG